jgi:hypothetical protein
MAGEDRQSYGRRARDQPEHDERHTEPRGAEAAHVDAGLPCPFAKSCSSRNPSTIEAWRQRDRQGLFAIAPSEDSMIARAPGGTAWLTTAP